jgi:hypothetical protein
MEQVLHRQYLSSLVPSKLSDNVPVSKIRDFLMVMDYMLFLAFFFCPCFCWHPSYCWRPRLCSQTVVGNIFCLFKSRRANVSGIAIVRIAEISHSKFANRRIYEQREICLVKFQLFGKDIKHQT